MSQQIIITQDDAEDGGWTFTGEVYSIDADGNKALVTSATANIGSTTGVSGWQRYINGASFVLDQMSDWLS